MAGRLWFVPCLLIGALALLIGVDPFEAPSVSSEKDGFAEQPFPHARSLLSLFVIGSVCLWSLAAAGLASPARAAHTFPPGSPFSPASGPDLITGFPSCEAEPGLFHGPIGLLVDGSSIHVTDVCNHTTYRFPPSGGSASSPQAQLDNSLNLGLAISHVGRYFGVVNQGVSNAPVRPHGLYSFNPSTLEVDQAQPLAQWSTSAFELALVADPLSADLYASSKEGIFQITSLDSNPTVIGFETSRAYDGLAFTADGSELFAAGSDGHVHGFNRDHTSHDDVDLLGHPPDGIAVAEPDTVIQTPSGDVDVSNNVFVNSTDGMIERIDTNNGNAVSVVATGGSRGDFATVGPDHCLYVTQSDSVEKLTPCFFQPTATNGYPRPKGATPMNVSLVPAYASCLSPNRAHGAPLADGSCNPPVQSSSYLTVGTPDANGAGANSINSIQLRVKGNFSDVLITSSITDVRCRSATSTTCAAANATAGPDYAGELQVRLPLRITDRNNSDPSSADPTGTVSDLFFGVTIPCAPTSSDAARGANCLTTTTTTANAVLSNTVVASERTLWQLGQVEVLDGGPSGNVGGGGNTTFLRQGVFVP
jgi:hypothetical protein